MLAHASIFIGRVGHTDQGGQSSRRWPVTGQHHLAVDYAAGEFDRARRRADPFLSPVTGKRINVVEAGPAAAR